MTGGDDLNCSLLGCALLRDLGTKPVNARVLAVPLLAVVGAAAFYLRPIPRRTDNLALEAVGGAVGLALGAAATADPDPPRANGSVRIIGGAVVAAIWIAAIGGRIALAELATHARGPAVVRFSTQHEITGADAWRTVFVLMAVAMVMSRVTTTGLAVARPHPRPATAAGMTANLGLRRQCVLVVGEDRSPGQPSATCSPPPATTS